MPEILPDLPKSLVPVLRKNRYIRRKTDMPAYDTLSIAVNDLHERGYTIDFRLHPHGLLDETSGDYLSPDKFKIAEFYRFEGDSNPDDASVVYAITSDNGELRGVLISAFGIYADTMAEKMLEKLHFKQ